MMEPLTPREFKALRDYASAHGRAWKLELNRAWMTGAYWSSDDAGTLQRLRNARGPSWLARFRFKTARVQDVPLKDAIEAGKQAYRDITEPKEQH